MYLEKENIYRIKNMQMMFNLVNQGITSATTFDYVPSKK